MIALLAAVASAQVSTVLSKDFELTDCSPRPIAGTVPYTIGRQAIQTNARPTAR